MDRTKSGGTCALCGHRTSKAAMVGHLERCAAAAAPETTPTRRRAAGADTKQASTTLFHLRVEGEHDPYHWLDLEIDGAARLLELDWFLRGIWLECCGHLSEFQFGRTRYLPPHALNDDFGFEDARSMESKLAEALERETRSLEKIRHVYDFGSSTLLTLRLMRQRQASGQPRPAVQILARNDPVEWSCSICKQAATSFCTSCSTPLYCEAHAHDHGCDDAMLLPVVDSPRMGVCAYTGPERAPSSTPSHGRKRKRR